MIKKGIEKLIDDFTTSDEFDLMEMMLSRISVMMETGKKIGIPEKDLCAFKENFQMAGTARFLAYIKFIYENIDDVMPSDPTTQLDPECIDHLLSCFEELEYVIAMLHPQEKTRHIAKFHKSMKHFDQLIANNTRPPY